MFLTGKLPMHSLIYLVFIGNNLIVSEIIFFYTDLRIGTFKCLNAVSIFFFAWQIFHRDHQIWKVIAYLSGESKTHTQN